MKRPKNSEFAYAKGREMRLAAEKESHEFAGLSSMVPIKPPLFSHDATLQIRFENVWNSVTACEVRVHLGIAKTDVGTDLIGKIRRFRECLSQSPR